jgi:hypothetical protein
MTDFDAGNFVSSGDPIAQTWMKGILGGLLVALILTAVVYYDTTPPSPLAPVVYQTQPLLPVMPAEKQQEEFPSETSRSQLPDVHPK